LDSILNYVVRIQLVLKQGKTILQAKQIIEFKKLGSCESPDLKESEYYLFMWLDESDNYLLNQNWFVKLWPRGPPNNKDKLILDQLKGLAC